MKARIIKIVSKDYQLVNENNERFDAILMGKIRQQKSPVAGDMVEAELIHQKWVIQKILPRYNHLIRPAVANVDQALIVMSVKDPNFSSTLVDRLSFLIVHANIKPLLCVTKIDLGISEDIERLIREYENGPMRVIRCTKLSQSEELKEVLKDKITVLTGQSGAGKSTLLNVLEPSFQLATQEISKALGRGKHTTRHNELHELCGGWVADTPGFSSLDFSTMTADDLSKSVLEFQSFLGTCKFNDCLHLNEPDCAIKKAVEEQQISKTRYENYLSVLKLIEERKEKYL